MSRSFAKKYRNCKTDIKSLENIVRWKIMQNPNARDKNFRLSAIVKDITIRDIDKLNNYR